MRFLTFDEKEQRGCVYCLNIKASQVGYRTRNLCPYEECPYHVLDNYETYEDFIESDESKIEALMR